MKPLRLSLCMIVSFERMTLHLQSGSGTIHGNASDEEDLMSGNGVWPVPGRAILGA
jgi:hypothetical protein